MKRKFSIMVIATVGCLILLAACGNSGENNQNLQNSEEQKAAVTAVVEEFGSRLKNVSLLAPAEELKSNMEENYGELVTPGLIEEWLKDPEIAPGRLTSSPWPEKIEVQSADQIPDGGYEVKGTIIEITSVEEATGGVAAKRPVSIHLKQEDKSAGWIINAVTMGPYEVAPDQNGEILYDNTEFGFRIRIPNTWKGFSVITGQWEGMSIPDQQGEKLIATGPSITIRHPLWTEKEPRQDIPIYIFTTAQWDAAQKEEFHIGAAPMAPSELGSNQNYVFALPARYNYSFPQGYEEVDQILQAGALEAY